MRPGTLQFEGGRRQDQGEDRPAAQGAPSRAAGSGSGEGDRPGDRGSPEQIGLAKRTCFRPVACYKQFGFATGREQGGKLYLRMLWDLFCIIGRLLSYSKSNDAGLSKIVRGWLSGCRNRRASAVLLPPEVLRRAALTGIVLA